jgi:micrococcal nuclease
MKWVPPPSEFIYTAEEVGPVAELRSSRSAGPDDGGIYPFLYFYRAKVVRVVDADTIDCDIDLGMNMWVRAGKTDSPGRLRLYGIDAWETRGSEKEAGLRAKQAVIELVMDADDVFIKTILDKQGKYGRYLADVFLVMDDKQVWLNEWLVDNGHAIWKDY